VREGGEGEKDKKKKEEKETVGGMRGEEEDRKGKATLLCWRWGASLYDVSHPRPSGISSSINMKKEK
jgi:hypothetical protein